MSCQVRRHYPCTICGRVGAEILNGYADGATDWPDNFFCSEKCIEDYKAAHPRWREEKAARQLATTHNCWMRQCCPKEEWDKWAFAYDPDTQMFFMGEFPQPYDADSVGAITEGFKNMVNNRKAADERLKADSEAYHRVMQRLRDTKRPHGLCQPRERRACTHCNAQDELDEMVKDYKGRPIRFAQTSDSE
jgi:hypothetical protein